MGRFILRARGANSGPVPQIALPPTITGPAREGDTLTAAAGSYITGYLEKERVWQDAPAPYDGATDISGATGGSWLIASGQVGKKVRYGERVRNGTGWSAWNWSDYTDVVVVAVSSTLLPATQTVNFGAKTRRGHGGHKLNYAGTGTISITSQKDAATADVTLFAINGYKELVLAGTYGTAPPTLTGGPYTVVVTDGTYSSTVTVPILSGKFHAAVNPANDTETSGTTSHQVAAILKLGTGVSYGDEILLRDGQYGATAAGANKTWTITKTVEFAGNKPGALFTGSITGTTLTVSAVASGALFVGCLISGNGIHGTTSITALGTGSGDTGTYTISTTQNVASIAMIGSGPYDPNFITIRSENVSGVVGDDVSAATFGAHWRILKLTPSGALGNVGLRFKNIEFNRIPDGTSSYLPCIIPDGGNRLIQIDHCRFIGTTSDGAVLGNTNGVSGIYTTSGSRSSFYVMENYQYNLYDGVTMLGDDLQVVGNTFVWMGRDNKLSARGIDAPVASTFAWNVFLERADNGVHGDDLQDDASKLSDALVDPDGFQPMNIYCNISTMGTITNRSGAQGGPFMSGWLAADSSTGRTLDAFSVNKYVRGNLYVNNKGNGMYFHSVQGLDVQYNTLSAPFDGAWGYSATGPNINVYSSTSVTAGNNILYGARPSGDTTSLQSIDTKAELTTALGVDAGNSFGANLNTRAAVIAAFTPQAASPAEGKGAIVSGVDWDAQTAVWPDGHKYVRPTPN